MNTPEGTGSLTEASSCLTGGWGDKERVRLFGKRVGKLHSLSLMNVLG